MATAQDREYWTYHHWLDQYVPATEKAGLPAISYNEFRALYPYESLGGQGYLEPIRVEQKKRLEQEQQNKISDLSNVVPPTPPTPVTPAGPSAAEIAAQQTLATTNQQIAGARTQADTDISNMQKIIGDYLKENPAEPRRTAEYGKIDLATQLALDEAMKKTKSEAAMRGGLYGGGYLGAVGEAQTAAELSKVTQKAGFETTLATEEAQKKLTGTQMMVDTYKTKISTAQSYAQMAQNQGQFDVSLAWQKESQRLNQESTDKWNTAKMEFDTIMAEINVAEKELDRLWQTGENEKAKATQMQIAKMNKNAQDSANRANMWGNVIGGVARIGATLLIPGAKTV